MVRDARGRVEDRSGQIFDRERRIRDQTTAEPRLARDELGGPDLLGLDVVDSDTEARKALSCPGATHEVHLRSPKIGTDRGEILLRGISSGPHETVPVPN